MSQGVLIYDSTGSPEQAFRAVTGTDAAGKGWVSDGSGAFVWTDVATQSELDTHANLTTTAHGGLVASSDARLTDTRTPTDASVTDAKIATTLSPSKITGTAVVTADSRLSDTRTPTDNSVTSAKIVDGAIVDADVNASAAIGESKLSLASDAAAGTASRRTLGTSSTSAAAGNDSRFPAGADIVAGDIAANAVTGVKLAADILAAGRSITFASGRILQSSGAATYLLSLGSNGTTVASLLASSVSGATAVFYFDPALYAISGMTTKLNVVAACFTNAAAPTVSFTFGLYPVSACAGTNGSNSITLGSVTSGSTVLFTTPGASTRSQGTSGLFSAPSAGFYALCVLTDGTSAASSTEALTATLLLSYA